VMVYYLVGECQHLSSMSCLHFQDQVVQESIHLELLQPKLEGSMKVEKSLSVVTDCGVCS